MTFPLLHTAAGEHTSFWIAASEILLDALLDTLKILPFLFLTYLFMEFLEHKAGDRLKAAVQKTGRAGPLAGGVLGLLPQCGFSAVAAGLYSGRVITLGTLLAVFLATSDEMLPVLLGASVPLSQVLAILGVKLAVALLVGFAADLLIQNHRHELHVTSLCEEEHCHCERGILRSALHHTLHMILLILFVNLALGAAFAWIGEEGIAAFVGGIPVLREMLGALVGLIPSCAASVVLATLYAKGAIPVGVMLAGLLPGAGTGILILARTNRPKRGTVAILGALFAAGVIVGLLFDCIPALSAFFSL